MKKKSTTLLNEAAVRKFMKLANLSKLTENFVDKLEEKDEDLPPEEDEGLPPEAPVGEPEGDLGPELEPEIEDEPGMGGVDEEVVTRLVDAIADAIEAETGVAIDVSGEAGEEAPEPEGDEAAPELEPEAPPAQDLAPPAPEEEEAPIMEGEELEEEAPVAESKEFGGTKDAKLTAAKKPESAVKAGRSKAGVVAESKSSKEKLIAEITNRVVARLKAEATKKGKK